jgi:predicted glycosyltransferase involved in capsule biosynthesis
MMGIIVPYRNREEHLSKFLPHMEKFLKDVDHQIFIIEQADDKPFNRGKLLSVGFSIAKESCDYVCFHDVDMLPLKADYSFPKTPTHLATAVEQFGFEMPYPTYFGGVTLFNIQDFELANGYANEYWGWGAEDDDLQFRCKLVGLEVDSRKGFFTSLSHEKVTENDPLVLANQDKLEELLYGPTTLPEEGLKTLEYTVLSKKSDGNIHTYKVQI